ncbi:4Fe-4S ferredoxin [Desulfuromonas versatilis]|uniref:4Fe-4S ferredoxin n=1 Tax=Desulfuromonas versatilis TaxID=2802975 RepID=A0ABM8HSM7_9BACT|nr:4Fe-4S dicluster domain-containing protein [Desulfuromonas versatilis]BCR03464.1 4Fe-4S ferredoxin [Desulfuromonas versatilis]
MKALTQTELETFLHALQPAWDVRAPIRLSDGTRALGRLEEGPLALLGGRIPRKPTDVFFAQQEKVFDALPDGSFRQEEPPQKPLFVLGFTAEDLECLEFIDRFFSSGFADDIYLRKRSGAVIGGLTGKCGSAGELLRIAGGTCDLELVFDGERFIVAAYSEAGEKLEAAMTCAESGASLEDLRRASEALPQDNRRLLEQASALLIAERVPDAFWAEIGERCIACTGCNLVCPTCTCFGVQDWRYPTHIERSRMWDSCQLDAFMREASGHNPLGSEALRTRRRIHHKLAADLRRWGHLTCYLCGRCDTTCPTGIGIVAVAREMVARHAGETARLQG